MPGLLAIGTLTLFLPADAAERPTLAVVGLHESGRTRFEQDEAIRNLVRAIEDDGRFAPIDPDEVALRIQGRERVIVEEGLLDSAVEKLHTGKGLYHQAAPESALLTLQAAVGEFLRAMPATNTVSDLWEAWVYIGTCQLQSEQPDASGARLSFQNAATLYPDRPLNEALFPPHVVDAYEAERQYLRKFPVVLDVTADGPATVWVDGVEQGRAPVRVEGLVPGEHHVVARGEGTLGYTIVSADVPVLAAGTPPSSARPPTFLETRLSLRLPVLGQAADSRVGRSQQTSSLYFALGNRAADLDYVLMVGGDDEQQFLQLLHTATESLSRPVELKGDHDLSDAAVDALPQLLDLLDMNQRLSNTVGAAVPLDVGSNSRLAELLLLPTDFGGPYNRRQRRRRGLVAGVTTAIVIGALAAGSYAYVATNPPN